MKLATSLRVRLCVTVALTACLGVFGGPLYARAAVSGTELTCAKLLGKSASKVAKTVMKELSKCRAADISGKATGSCPNAANQSRIAAAVDSVKASAQAKCKSVCSVSNGVECIADNLCPPRVTPTSGSPESCSGVGSKAYFNMANLGFPGALCEAKLSRGLTVAGDLGECTGELAADAATEMINAIYGSITNASGISADAQRCLSSISKGSQKLSKIIVKSVSKCRNGILAGASGDPATCQTADPKTVTKIAKLEAKLDALVDSSCDDAMILELDLCGNGVGQTASRVEAKSCIKAAVREVSDSNVPPVLRTYGETSVIDAAYPARARCGDDKINQLPNARLLLGEECDGQDSDACPGDCLPPGDTFECTCGNRPRMRVFASHEETDADAGWTGISHQQGVADLSGYITDLSDCDCDAFNGPTCTGTSSDPICTVKGTQVPSCSWEPFSGTRCDLRNPITNNIDEDRDCAICDSWSANAGAFCKDERDCDAQCYDAAGVPSTSCDKQTDCAAGEICRGQCDDSQTCLVIPNGAPLPVAAAGAMICAVQHFRTDVNGTRNVITGAHEVTYRLYSIIHLGESKFRPCPVCGGFCVGGSQNLEVCEGRCSTTTTTPCRFDVDCPSGETCTKNSPDCPGGFCQTDLICGAIPTNPIAGQPCFPEYEHPSFGSMSNDCLPFPGANITGQGFQIDYLGSPTSTPVTTGFAALPSVFPCTASGFENYLCPCPGGTGEPTKPNSCAPACDAAGPDFGTGCGTGNNNSGAGSTCAGGVGEGRLCRTDADCPSSSCINPTHCVGGPAAYEHNPCATNAECGGGTCADACPGGRCVPLCVPTLDDPDEGLCAAGPPVNTCENPRFKFVTCEIASAQSNSCSATCSVSGTPCERQSDCPTGQTCNGPCLKAKDCEAGGDGVLGNGDDNESAGRCVSLERSCYVDPLQGTGGTTVNGQGSPEHENTIGIYCYSATTNGGVNANAGFPGPGRVRQRGTNITNGFTAIPVP